MDALGNTEEIQLPPDNAHRNSSEHLGSSLELTFDITDQIRDFVADDVDVAIRFGTGRYERARSDRLFDTVVVLICSPRLLKSGARLEKPGDLLQHTLCYMAWKTASIVWPDWRTPPVTIRARASLLRPVGQAWSACTPIRR
ncbi:LysR substrate-binding domain-containing protein [Arenibaculum pallidiluteum]|uniref:LysR substrate-binding domain-containing protein n=1 Tax=Arenibaculum pallidiluteum TaxID=2812559 RepID=UPI001A966C7C